MKLQILQENLNKAVGIASRFASTKAQLPILGNILLSAQKTKLVVSSTNLEVSVSVQTGAKVEQDGDLCVPSRVIGELVSNLPRETVSLSSDKEQLKIAVSEFSSNVLGMNTSDFPKIPNSLSKPIVLPKKEILESLSQVIFAASMDETRPVLTGALLVLTKNSITLAATDGFRLSQKKISITDQKGEFVPQKIVIPKGVLSELGRSSEEADDIKFEVQEKEKQVIFGLGNVTLSSRLLEGEYPDYEKIIPKNSTLQILADKEELLRAVKLASIFARDAANIVRLKILKDSIKIAAESGSSGSQETNVEAKIEGSAKDFEIAFNYRFLEEFLHSVNGDEVKMEFSGANAPGVFTDTKDSSYLHLIMPVKVQS